MILPGLGNCPPLIVLQSALLLFKHGDENCLSRAGSRSLSVCFLHAADVQQEV